MLSPKKRGKVPGMRLIAPVIVCLWYAVYCQTDVVRYALELDQVPSSCRVAALGDAGVAIPLDAVSIFWNPAAHAFIDKYEVSAEYARLYGGLSTHGCVAAHVPLQEQMSVAAMYVRFQSGAISLWDSLPGTETERLNDPSMRADASNNGYFYNDQNMVTVSLAKLFSVPIGRPETYNYPMPMDLSAGINFKEFWQTLNPSGKVRMGMNINCDAGLLLRVSLDYDLQQKMVDREVYVGATVKDLLGTKEVWLHSPDNYQETVDLSQYYGIAYIDKTHLLGANWLVTAALERSYETTYHCGIEAQVFNMVALRLGVSQNVFTCGAGVTYKNYSLDYAFRFDDVDYSPLRLSLKVAF